MISWKNIPAALRERDQWVLWKYVARTEGDPTKVPVRPDGTAAKTNDPATWSTFATVRAAYVAEKHAGPGFVFAAADPFCGIDLDGCRDPKSGKVADWAREIVLDLGSYAEVSPSGTGVKVFASCKSPFAGGRKVELHDAERVCAKAPAIEVYDRGRYFAVTGQILKGPMEPTDATDALARLKTKYWPDRPAAAPPAHEFNSDAAVLERARKYLARMPGAVSGRGGHNATFRAACVLVLGFELPPADALALLQAWNATCQPPWVERDIERKVREAAKQPGERGYLRNAQPANWERIRVPEYHVPQLATAREFVTIADAAERYLDKLRKGEETHVKTGIPELDHALSGGLAYGEMVICGARPSHCKSAFALQCLHHWSAGADAAPGVLISEEMSALALGKRTLQFVSGVPQPQWEHRTDDLAEDLARHKATHKDWYIVESCGTADAACAAVERAVKEFGARYAVIDYAQLLRAPGKTRYEQTTNTSIMLRQLATRTKIVLFVLAQLSRSVEMRPGPFMPIMSDLKDTGQLEQDADVIVLQCWPHKLDPSEPKERFQFFIAKNRNRDIRVNRVECRFDGGRQMFGDPRKNIGTEGVEEYL